MSTTIKNMPLARQDFSADSAIPADSFTVVRQLAANTAETFSIPSYTSAGSVTVYAKRVLITTTATTYATYTPVGAGDVTATVPAGDTTDGTGADIILTTVARLLDGLEKISLISAGTPNVSLIFFRE
jgi:hypothetical protein